MLNPLRGSHVNLFLYLRFHRRLFKLIPFHGIAFIKPLKGFNLNNRGCQPTESDTIEVTTLKGLNYFIINVNQIYTAFINLVHPVIILKGLYPILY